LSNCSQAAADPPTRRAARDKRYTYDEEKLDSQSDDDPAKVGAAGAAIGAGAGSSVGPAEAKKKRVRTKKRPAGDADAKPGGSPALPLGMVASIAARESANQSKALRTPEAAAAIVSPLRVRPGPPAPPLPVGQPGAAGRDAAPRLDRQASVTQASPGVSPLLQQPGPTDFGVIFGSPPMRAPSVMQPYLLSAFCACITRFVGCIGDLRLCAVAA
jgi:hypothetical protein